jgi:hypothetical protein
MPPTAQKPPPSAAPAAPAKNMRKYRVCAGGCFINGNQRLSAGAIFDGDPISVGILDALKNGYIEQATGPAKAQESLIERVPGRDTRPALRNTKNPDGTQETVMTAHAGGITQSISKPAQPPASIVQPRSKWDVDPATLEGKTIEQLNVMVAERDPSIQAFPTAPEAAAFLCQDFNRPDAPAVPPAE